MLLEVGNSNMSEFGTPMLWVLGMKVKNAGTNLSATDIRTRLK